VLLLFVDTEDGARAAREAEAAVRLLPPDEPAA
jgi:hypothetical protein